MLKKTILSLFVLIIFSCYTGIGEKVTILTQVETPSFILKFEPLDDYKFLKGFYLDKANNNTVINFNKGERLNKFSFIFSVAKIPADMIRNMSPEEISKFYMDTEVHNMVKNGVQTGMYNLHEEINSDEISENGKTYYQFSYITYTNIQVQYNNIYLFIDKPTLTIKVLLHSEAFPRPSGQFSLDGNLSYTKRIPLLLKSMKLKS